MAAHNGQPGGLRRLIGRVVLVREGEMPALLWSAAYFFFVLTSYYIVRPVREALGIDRSADDLPWLMTGTMAVMLLANPLFAWLVSVTPRRIFMPWTYRFFALNLIAFFAAAELMPGAKWLGYAFYIWVSVFNLFATSLFWALMADGFSSEQSKRLFGFVGVGGTLGAIAGGAFTATLVSQIGAFGVMLVSAFLLLVAAQCVRRLINLFGLDPGIERVVHGPPKCPACGYDIESLPERSGNRTCPECGAEIAAGARKARMPRTPEPGPGVLTGLSLVAKSPYLLLICVYLFLFATLSTFLYLQQGQVIEAASPDRETRTRFFAQIDIATNVLTLVTQMFLTARIVKRIGIGATLGILPAVSIVGFAALWAAPTIGLPLLGTLMVFQVARRGLHYAVSRPAREMLFTVLGQDEKYKSKPFIDTFVYRGGDLFGAWSPKAMVAAAGKSGIAAIAAIPMAAIPLAALSLGVGLVLGRMQKAKARAIESARRDN